MAVDHESAFLEALQNLNVSPATVDKTAAVDASPVNSANVWRHIDAHPIVLDMLLLRRYGPEWLSWEPETLQALIPEDFKTEALSDLNLSKIQACKVLHLVDSFWNGWEVFLACAMPFNNEFPDFQVMQVPTVAQCLVACDVANRIREDVTWSQEVKVYVAQVYHHDGIFMPLPPADFVSLEVPDEINAKELALRWPEVRASKKEPGGNSMEDEQLRRMLVANTFLEESRTRLNQQLRLIHV